MNPPFQKLFLFHGIFKRKGIKSEKLPPLPPFPEILDPPLVLTFFFTSTCSRRLLTMSRIITYWSYPHPPFQKSLIHPWYLPSSSPQHAVEDYLQCLESSHTGATPTPLSRNPGSTPGTYLLLHLNMQ